MIKALAPKRDFSKNRAGFTIVELMIASAVFSVVLLVCASGLIQIGRVYYKGITSSQTQESARSIMDDISRAIQFSGGRITQTLVPPTSWDSQDRFCIGGNKYSFQKGKQLVDSSPTSDQTRQALVISEDAACGSPNLTAAGSKEFLTVNQRVVNLKVEPVPGTLNLYRVNLVIAAGDEELFIKDVNGYVTACKSSRLGGQFCAISELNTTVQKRVQ